MIQFFYTFFIYPLVHAFFFLLSYFNTKVALGFAVRKKKSWLKDLPSSKPVIWFHVASGEFEYAKPVIREIKKNQDCQILVTFFSPSAIGSLKMFSEVDIFVPMPWDTPWNWSEFISHYNPSCLAIARTDTWPNLVWQSWKYKIPSILFSATLPDTSGRVASFWGRIFYGSIIENLDSISCVSENDRDNFLRLNADTPITIDGDTRFDQVSFRLHHPKILKLSNSPYVTQNPTVFVAGSTWPEDEKIILPSLKKPIEQGLSVLIAPHEPTQKHIASLQQQLAALGISKTRLYSQIKEESSNIEQGEVILIDQVGILAELYSLGTISFVGGSFKKSVHSVMEPAAAGNLVTFGPFYFNNREALALKKKELSREVTSSKDLELLLLAEMKIEKPTLTSRKNQILKFVEENSGVSHKIYEWIKEHKKSRDFHQPRE